MSLDRYPAVSMCTAFSSMTERRFFYVRRLAGQGFEARGNRPNAGTD